MSADLEPTTDEQTSLDEAMEKYWGFSTYRPLQREAMECVLAGQDSVVVLPTGGGKSLCFQAPALCMPGVALVVSPLISLMKDQVDALQSSGVQAAFINSHVGYKEKMDIANAVRSKRLKILYMAPERLVAERTISFLRNEANLSFVAIDEAHCISEWGHDFRPEYRQLAILRETFPEIGFHSYTATATTTVRADIQNQLQLKSPTVLVGSFDRPNLVYHVARKTAGLNQVMEVIGRHKGDSGIIYCTKRADTESYSSQLNALGLRTMAYHAGLEPNQRQRCQDAFIREEVDIIVATVAFGMGIDKSNVRYVIHIGMPKSLENYQQESGRAGRDQLEAECVLLYQGGDYGRWKYVAEESGNVKASMRNLYSINGYANGAECRHKVLVEYFGQTYQPPNESSQSCNACDFCLGSLEMVDEPLIVGQKILSSVVRQGQRFGGDYTAKVLKGSQEQRVVQNGHDSLSTFGLLKEFAVSSIRDWIEQLCSQGFIIKEGEYNILTVTEPGWKLLRGEVAPRLLKPRVKRTKKAEAGKTSKVEQDSWEGVDRGLFEHLRVLRRQQAEKSAMPAYIIFGDGALRDMARRRSVTLDVFSLVKGVGQRKLQDYGEVFCKTISDYCQQHKLATNVTPKPVDGREE